MIWPIFLLCVQLTVAQLDDCANPNVLTFPSDNCDGKCLAICIRQSTCYQCIGDTCADADGKQHWTNQTCEEECGKSGKCQMGAQQDCYFCKMKLFWDATTIAIVTTASLTMIAAVVVLFICSCNAKCWIHRQWTKRRKQVENEAIQESV